MKIETWIFGFLNDDIPDKYRGKSVYVADDNTLTINQLIKSEFKLKIAEVNILLNGSFLNKNVLLKDGDQIKIFPPVAGG